jgi:hypothetical protein
VSAIATSPWLTFAASIIGGGAVGALISAYVTAGREGRTARAKVRECLAETEDLRWLDADYAEFRKALTRLEAAAIIARFDRSLIRRYTYLAQVAHFTEMAERREHDWLPPRTLPAELALLLEGTVVTITHDAWRPRLWRFRRKQFLWVLDKTIERRRAEHPEWSWTSVLFTPRLMTKQPGLRAALKHGRARLLPAPHRPSREPEPTR